MFKRRKSRVASKPSISWPMERSQPEAPPMPALPVNPPPPPPPPTAGQYTALTATVVRHPSVTYHRPATSAGSKVSNHSARPSDASTITQSSTYSRDHSPIASPTSPNFPYEPRRSVSAATRPRSSYYHAFTTSIPAIQQSNSSAEHFHRHNQVASPVSSPYSPDGLSNCSSGACSTVPTDLSLDVPSEFELPEEVPESEDTPTQEKWLAAGEIPIFDSDGRSRKFKTLYEGEQAIGEQQLIIFVRHFFCGACQAYLKSLSTALPLETYFTLPTPSSITIIGLGDPKLIPFYRQTTGTSFPIYTDPSRSLYKKLGMSWTVRPGARVDYMNYSSEWSWVSGQVKQLRDIDKDKMDRDGQRLKFKGGNPMWIGGELLVRDSKVVWMRRMKTYRGHVGTSEIKKLLGAEF